MSSLTSSRKEKRLTGFAEPETVVSDRIYNLVMGGTIFYGIIVNVIMCFAFGDMLEGVNIALFLVFYFVSCVVGTIMSSRSDNPIISFIGYNLVVVPVGMVVSSVIAEYGGLGSYIVFQAFLITAAISGAMILLSIAYPSFFARLGGLLLGALTGLIIIEIIFIILGIPQIWTSWVAAVIFSLYIGYDYWRAQEYPKTVDNAVDSALDIYLDIINLFIRILRILGSSRNDNRD